jgi:hypothetical protein
MTMMDVSSEKKRASEDPEPSQSVGMTDAQMMGQPIHESELVAWSDPHENGASCESGKLIKIDEKLDPPLDEPENISEICSYESLSSLARLERLVLPNGLTA